MRGEPDYIASPRYLLRALRVEAEPTDQVIFARWLMPYFGNSSGRASSDVNMHRALCPHSGTILTT